MSECTDQDTETERGEQNLGGRASPPPRPTEDDADIRVCRPEPMVTTYDKDLAALAQADAEWCALDNDDTRVLANGSPSSPATNVRLNKIMPREPAQIPPKRLRLDKNVLGRDLDFSIPPGVDKFPPRIGGPIYPPPGALRTR